VLLGFAHEVHIHAVDTHRDHVVGGEVRITQCANLLIRPEVCVSLPALAVLLFSPKGPA
jgi:hypothetical protein